MDDLTAMECNKYVRKHDRALCGMHKLLTPLTIEACLLDEGLCSAVTSARNKLKIEKNVSASTMGGAWRNETNR